MIIRNCPNGLHLALKISEVTPIKEAISVKWFFLSKMKNDMVITIAEQIQSENSPFEK